MSFANLYRISFYAMLVCASLVLSIDATDSKLSMLYPPLVAAAAAVAYVKIDRKGGPGLPTWALNIAGLISLALALAEYKSNTEQLLLLSLGHWLIYLQLILIFQAKTVGSDWRMFLLGLVQVLIGTVISQSDSVGVMLAAWAVLALWVLGLFSLHRESIRSRGVKGSTGAAGAAEAEPYPDLLNVPYMLSASRVMLTTLALGGVIFLTLPRRVGSAPTKTGDVPGQHLTGFDDQVQLGQMGEILENDSVVMSIEMFDERGNRYYPEGEPLWRGVTMGTYQNGRWERTRRADFATLPTSLPDFMRRAAPGRPRGTIRQQIKLEPNDSPVLFGLRPIREVSAGRRSVPELNPHDGSISRADSRSGGFDYEVVSLRDSELPQPGETPLGPYPRRRLLAVPDEIRPRLEEIAKAVLEKLPAGERDDPKTKARALENYFLSSGEFGYTLNLDVIDRKIDPVLDFLINRKEGHCEYFASALTLLLRVSGIPARMVNGFKGGDWNELSRVMNVRQKHAHSWVEAFVGQSPVPERLPIWLTLDPTPGTERQRSVAKVGGFKANFYQFTDAVRYLWVFYIVGYDSDRQNKLIYAPVRATVREARRGFSMIATELQKTRVWLLNLIHLRDARSIISVRGFAVTFSLLLFLTGLARVAAIVYRRIVGAIRGKELDDGALSAGAVYYRRLAQLLSGYGLERPPAETQDEFARRATQFLAARGSDTEAVADVPRAVVDAYYRVRFGEQELSPAAVHHLESRLDTLEASLKAPQA